MLLIQIKRRWVNPHNIDAVVPEDGNDRWSVIYMKSGSEFSVPAKSSEVMEIISSYLPLDPPSPT